jgi:serine/threonine-protein kinase
MSGIDFARVREAFDRASAVPAGHPDRAAVLAALSPAEAEELAGLLAAHDGGGTRDEMRRRVDGAAAASLPASAAGQRLGPWRVTGQLGEGGMGVVLAALRDDGQFEQRAAIKVIRGFPSEGARERLRRERQILAALEHPNIARVLDGGTTEAGEPYLVMEFIDGEPLPAWLARAPSLRARMKLFASVCRAVAFAHQRLVVHRDLKPANVMVRPDGTPVLLDFGIARLVEDGPGGEGTRTQSMTPAYASPEQLRGEPVTTATDVFGLGLVLFVLLGGDVAERSDPVKAATTTVDDASSAARRSADAAARGFAGLLRGDLDAIVRLATRIDPQRRYGSALLLQQDIEAWLDGRPVSARAGDRWYLLATFARRHRALLAFGALLLAAGAAFTLRLAVERDRAQAAREQAESEARTTREVLAFVTGLFGELDPANGGDADITARELLDRGRDKLDGVQASSPRARAALQHTMGDIYQNSEMPRPALELLGAAREEYLRDPGAVRELVRIEIAIAQAHDVLLDARSAWTYIEAARQRAEPLAAEDPKLLAHVLMTHGITQQRLGRGAEASADFERAQALFERAGEAGREGLAGVLHNRGWLAFAAGDYPAALDWYQRAIAGKTALQGKDHPSTLISRSTYTLTLAALDRLQEAETELVSLLADTTRRMGERSEATARTWNELASIRHDLGRYVEAAQGYQRSIDLSLAAEGGRMNTSIAQTVNNLASLDEERGDFAAAERGYRESLAVRLREQPETSTIVTRARHNLARILVRQGRFAEAEPLALAARRVRDDTLPAGALERLASQALVAEILLGKGDREGALREAAALAAALPALQVSVRQISGLQRTLARIALATGDGAGARRHAEAAVAALRTALADDHPLVAMARLDLADALAATDPRAAADLHRRAAAVLDPVLAPGAPDRMRWRAASAG